MEASGARQRQSRQSDVVGLRGRCLESEDVGEFAGLDEAKKFPSGALPEKHRSDGEFTGSRLRTQVARSPASGAKGASESELAEEAGATFTNG